MGDNNESIRHLQGQIAYLSKQQQIVALANTDFKNRLLSIGERIKEKYQKEFDTLKALYMEAVLKAVPMYLQKVKAYELQFLFIILNQKKITISSHFL